MKKRFNRTRARIRLIKRKIVPFMYLYGAGAFSVYVLKEIVTFTPEILKSNFTASSLTAFILLCIIEVMVIISVIHMIRLRNNRQENNIFEDLDF